MEAKHKKKAENVEKWLNCINGQEIIININRQFIQFANISLSAEDETERRKKWKEKNKYRIETANPRKMRQL